MTGHLRTPGILFSSDPITIRIGVTGHRELRDPSLMRRSVRWVLADLDRRLAETPHRYCAVSALAEGADRLVAECVLEWKGHRKSVLLPPELEIVLPMPEEQYVETFDREKRAESIAAFESFLGLATAVRELPLVPDRHDAYSNAGKYVVEHCHVLIAIWNGKNARGKGGTAEIVEFAKSTDCSIFWINSASGKVKPIRSRGGLVRDVDFLHEYNREPVSSRQVNKDVQRRLASLKTEAQDAGLNPAVLDPLADGILPHFVKATSLAGRYQHLYFIRSVEIPYILSALAVLTAALGAIVVRPESHWLGIPALRIVFGVEALWILLVLWMGWPAKRRSRQRKWIDYRYLAERLRASIFLYVAGLSEETSAAPPDQRLTWLSDQWVTIALRELWNPLHSSETSREHAQPERDPDGAARFLLRAWIAHQQKYYHQTGAKNHKIHGRIELWLAGLILATLVAAILHVILSHENPFAPLLSIFAVSLPAIASSLAGISVFRNFYGNAERYESMSRHLEEIGKRMGRGEPPTAPKPEPHLSTLQQFVREAEAAMAREHQGWRAVIGVHLPGPG
jgi:conflict system pore-forming effector with SLATT domain